MYCRQPLPIPYTPAGHLPSWIDSTYVQVEADTVTHTHTHTCMYNTHVHVYTSNHTHTSTPIYSTLIGSMVSISNSYEILHLSNLVVSAPFYKLHPS